MNYNDTYPSDNSWHSTGIPSVLERQDTTAAMHSPPGIPYSKKVLKGDNKKASKTSSEKVNRNYQSKQFKYLSDDYTNWLKTLGYSNKTVLIAKNNIDEFFAFLEANTITALKDFNEEITEEYLGYIQNRPNQMKPGSLSAAYINKHITTLRSFSRYLHISGKSNIVIKPNLLETSETATFLSKTEIQQLYRAAKDDRNIYNQRDTAMLSVFYGCGLRASEGEALKIQDVLFDKNLLFVRKGKNYTQRYVPINENVISDLQTYLFHQRNILQTQKNDTFFLNRKGKQWTTQGMYHRLQWLKNKTNNPELKNRAFGLHILRHSIATHLLQSGMKLEVISRFLGHKSLETTQKYLHLAHE